MCEHVQYLPGAEGVRLEVLYSACISQALCSMYSACPVGTVQHMSRSTVQHSTVFRTVQYLCTCTYPVCNQQTCTKTSVPHCWSTLKCWTEYSVLRMSKLIASLLCSVCLRDTVSIVMVTVSSFASNTRGGWLEAGPKLAGRLAGCVPLTV